MTYTIDTGVFIKAVLNKKALNYVNEIVSSSNPKGIFIRPVGDEAKNKLLDLYTQIVRLLNDPTRKKISHGTISLINTVLYGHFNEKIPGFVDDLSDKFNKNVYNPFFESIRVQNPKLKLDFVLNEKMKIILIFLKKINECRNFYPSLKRDFMNQSVANHSLRNKLKEFGNFISNPIKIKLIYTDMYGKQISGKVDFITMDFKILKNKEEIEKILKFVNIVDYDQSQDFLNLDIKCVAPS